MKPFTSKHCVQYLSKTSPLQQLDPTKKMTQSVEPVEKKGPPVKPVDTLKVKTVRQPQRIYKDVDGVVRDEDNKDVGYPTKATTN